MDQTEVHKFKEGDRRVYRKLFDKYYSSLCLFANSYVSDLDQAEDFVQEVFVVVWEKRSDFTAESAIKAFLYESVRNKALNYIKHLDVRKRYSESHLKTIEDDLFFHDHLIEEETHRIIHTAVAGLPESSQKIILLSIQGLKNQEIAEELNISINTVKSQKKLAYSQLRFELKDLFLSFLALI